MQKFALLFAVITAGGGSSSQRPEPEPAAIGAYRTASASAEAGRTGTVEAAFAALTAVREALMRPGSSATQGTILESLSEEAFKRVAALPGAIVSLARFLPRSRPPIRSRSGLSMSISRPTSAAARASAAAHWSTRIAAGRRFSGPSPGAMSPRLERKWRTSARDSPSRSARAATPRQCRTICSGSLRRSRRHRLPPGSISV